MKRIIGLVILLFFTGCLSQAQKLPAFDIIAGFGFPEAFHIGCKMHAFKHSQLGLYYGNNLDFTSQEMYHSVTVDHQLHLGKVSEIDNRPPWFFRQGLSYAIDLNKYDLSDNIKFLFLIFSGGREFSISKKIGFSADAGLFLTLMEKNSEDYLHSWLDISFKDQFAWAFVRLQLYYSL